MSKRTRQYIGILAALAAYYLVHEGAHLLYALLTGVFRQINFMGLGVQIDVCAETHDRYAAWRLLSCGRAGDSLRRISVDGACSGYLPRRKQAASRAVLSGRTLYVKSPDLLSVERTETAGPSGGASSCFRPRALLPARSVRPARRLRRLSASRTPPPAPAWAGCTAGSPPSRAARSDW